MTTALLDADIICYQSSLVCEGEVDWGEEGVGSLAHEGLAREIAFGLVEKWKKASGCKKVRLVFSDRSAPKTSFRYHVHPHYKANRSGEKPDLHDDVYRLLREHFPSTEWPGLEGDDTLGLMATGEDGAKYTIVSMDKDMLTLPGARVLITPKTGPITAKPRKISALEADRNWMMQTLTGDTVDNYKGAPGIGEKKAEQALAPCITAAEMFEAARYLFGCQFGARKWKAKFVTDSPEAEFLMNARCARILRHGDMRQNREDPRNPHIRLWHPDADKVSWINPF